MAKVQRRDRRRRQRLQLLNSENSAPLEVPTSLKKTLLDAFPALKPSLRPSTSSDRHVMPNMVGTAIFRKSHFPSRSRSTVIGLVGGPVLGPVEDEAGYGTHADDVKNSKTDSKTDSRTDSRTTDGSQSAIRTRTCRSFDHGYKRPQKTGGGSPTPLEEDDAGQTPVLNLWEPPRLEANHRHSDPKGLGSGLVKTSWHAGKREPRCDRLRVSGYAGPGRGGDAGRGGDWSPRSEVSRSEVSRSEAFSEASLSRDLKQASEAPQRISLRNEASLPAVRPTRERESGRGDVGGLRVDAVGRPHASVAPRATVYAPQPQLAPSTSFAAFRADDALAVVNSAVSAAVLGGALETAFVSGAFKPGGLATKSTDTRRRG